MKRSILVFALCALGLAAGAKADNLPGLTVAKHIKANDNRGKVDITYLQLTPKAAPRAVRTAVNAALAKNARDYLCEANAERSKDMSSTVSMKVTYASREAISFSLNYDIYCGGPYPDAGLLPSIYDLRTGREVKVEDQVRDADAFKNLVVAKVMASLPRNSDCVDFYTPESLKETSFKYALAKGKLVATQDYPHVARACEFDTDLPLSELANLVKPGSTLDRLLKK